MFQIVFTWGIVYVFVVDISVGQMAAHSVKDPITTWIFEITARCASGVSSAATKTRYLRKLASNILTNVLKIHYKLKYSS